MDIVGPSSGFVFLLSNALWSGAFGTARELWAWIVVAPLSNLGESADIWGLLSTRGQCVFLFDAR